MRLYQFRARRRVIGWIAPNYPDQWHLANRYWNATRGRLERLRRERGKRISRTASVSTHASTDSLTHDYLNDGNTISRRDNDNIGNIRNARRLNTSINATSTRNSKNDTRSARKTSTSNEHADVRNEENKTQAEATSEPEVNPAQESETSSTAATAFSVVHLNPETLR